jgi:D-alanine-D-alanine ligase
VPQLTLAFLYNVRHVYPDADDLRTQVETDFDDAATIEAMTRHLEGCGYRVIPIEADEQAYLELHRRRSEIDLALNYSMGLHGAARYAHLPAMLEMLQIPYTGSDPLTQALILNKERMQQVVAAAGGPVLPSWVPRAPEEARPAALGFPLIVKPVGQGSSAGITAASVVHDAGALREQVRRMVDTFGEPPLVQPLLGGREFSVPMLGNPPRVLPPIEPDFSLLPPGYLPIDSLEVKWVFEEQSETNHLRCPAPVDADLAARIERTVRLVWDALGLRDWCRIDLRADAAGTLYVLDVNSPPGMIPPEISTTSYFSLAGRAIGLGYDDLLQQVIETARARTARRA